MLSPNTFFLYANHADASSFNTIFNFLPLIIFHEASGEEEDRPNKSIVLFHEA